MFWGYFVAIYLLQFVLAYCRQGHVWSRDRNRQTGSSEHVRTLSRAGGTHGLYRVSPQTAAPRCTAFQFYPCSLMLDGDVTVLVARGHHVSPELCKRYCLVSHPHRYCVAANYHRTGACYLTGYELFSEFNTNHYRKLCRRGKSCFRRFTGMASRAHTGLIAIPDVTVTSLEDMANICRRECERNEYCVGFDVAEGRRFCPMVSFRRGINKRFSLFRRRC